MKVLALALFASAQAFAATSVKSVYTDTVADCIVVSSATNQAPIDFSESECKAFGGYRLGIAGGDLRYHPELSYGGSSIDLATPGAFHDVASQKIEWVYKHTIDNEGSGSVKFVGLIYRLSVQKEDGQGNDSILYAVRLDGAKSCLIGSTDDNVKARELVAKSTPGCK